MRSIDAKIKKANTETIKKIVDSNPVLIDMGKAMDVIPGMRKDLFLHSGPPIAWEKMCGPVKGAVLGAVIYEGFAGSLQEAEEYVDSGRITFSPTHHYNSAAPMAGIISPSMPVFIIRNETYKNMSYSNINEGVGQVKTLRFGANNEEVIIRLKWIETILGPALKNALKIGGPINLRDIIAEALRRGDECHNRNKSSTLAFLQQIIKPLLGTDLDKETIASIVDFINKNVHFFLNLSIAACKATLDAARNIDYSTIVTAMSTNGVEFGIQVSGLFNEWFTGPAPTQYKGKIFKGYTKEDANPLFGDSYISEPSGIGGFAMAASPAIAEFVGGTPSYGVQITNQMYKITYAKHKIYKIPYLDFQGTPTGIDIRRVVKTKIAPIINTGLASKQAGIGQIGAGIAKVPLICFKKAAQAYKKKYEVTLK